MFPTHGDGAVPLDGAGLRETARSPHARMNRRHAVSEPRSESIKLASKRTSFSESRLRRAEHVTRETAGHDDTDRTSTVDLNVPRPRVAVGHVTELSSVEAKAVHKRSANAMHGVHAAERYDANLDGNRGEASTETVDVEASARDTAVRLGLDCATRIGERARAVRDCSSSALDKRRTTRGRRLATGIRRHTGANPHGHCGAQGGHARRIRPGWIDTVRTGRLGGNVEERHRVDGHARISALRGRERIRVEALDVRRGVRRRNRKRSKTPSRAVEHHAAAGRAGQSARAARHHTKADDARRAVRTRRVGMRRGRGGDRTHNASGAEDQRSGMRTRDLKGACTG